MLIIACVQFYMEVNEINKIIKINTFSNLTINVHFDEKGEVIDEAGTVISSPFRLGGLLFVHNLFFKFTVVVDQIVFLFLALK